VALSCEDRHELNKEAYSQAVNRAELLLDISQLPAGDDTEIGAHGINLSGGQKARVGMARALYQCAACGSDFVVLDDVLSAVDMAVAHKLINRSILGALRGTTRVVVLNSHYELLESADLIVVMVGGKAVVYDSLASYSSSPWAAALADLQLQRQCQGPHPNGTGSFLFQDATSKETKLSMEVPAWIAEGLPTDFMHAAQAEATVASNGDTTCTSAKSPAMGDDDRLDLSGRLLVPEDRAVGLLSFRTYKLYFGQGRGLGLVTLAAILLLITATECARITCDFWAADWSSAQDGLEPSRGLVHWLGGYTVIVAITAMLCFVRSAAFMAFARDSSRRIHEKMLARLLRAPVNLYFDTVPTAQILNRFSKDLDVLDTMLPHYLLEFLQDWTFLLGTVIVVVWKAVPVLFVMPICGYGFIRMRGYYMATSRELKRLEATARSPLLAGLAEAMEGITTIRMQRLEPSFQRRFLKLAEKNGTLFFHSWIMIPWLVVRADGIGSIFVLATAVSLAFMRGATSPISSALTFTFVMAGVSKLQWAVRQSIEAENYLTSVERCEHFERIPQELEPEHGLSPHELAAMAERGDHPAIEFREVSVRYRPRLPLVVRSLSFSVGPGERVGVIGRTGCGKSTITLCLFRLLETEMGSEVLLHGVSIRSLRTSTLRRALSTIPQVPLIYSGSLRDNLDPFSEYCDEDLWRALKDVSLEHVVRQAGAGLELILEEDGVNLSAGQRQLLAIARAALRRSCVVICDEATSSCDPQADALVQRLLGGGSKTASREENPLHGAAMLTIAHRLDTLDSYDRVLLLSAPSSATSNTGIHEISRTLAVQSKDLCRADAAGSVMAAPWRCSGGLEKHCAGWLGARRSPQSQ